ncbi:MAG TPA: DUF3887 domain-containing protein [Clostridia bacterium]|nr:MAG: hypothetical protein BWY62_00083 [Firmicutes bacterium ADurb.Bin356]HOR12378.1 DUF3887 domain-containing protein [Clostridia bacterium]
MQKRIISVAVCIMLMLATNGCTRRVSEAFNEKDVISRAESTVLLINAGEFDKLSDTAVREELRDVLSSEALMLGAETMLAEAGSFVEFGQSAVVGEMDKNSGEEYAVVVLQAKYEKKALVYTIAFDTDLWIVGLYIK